MFENLNFTTNGRCLTQTELQKLTAFNLYLLNKPFTTRVIFRGENYDNLKEKLDLNGNDDYPKLSQYLFLLGEKGRTYRRAYRAKISNQKKVYSIDDISQEIFSSIFKKLNKVLKRTDKPEIQKFKKKNDSFSIYFSAIEKRLDFLEKINSLSNKADKIHIRDYYLSLLHQIGQIGFYNNSFFVSTTTNFKIAQIFSNSNNSDKIVLVSWGRFAYGKVGIPPRGSDKVNQFIIKNNLPSYESTFFPKQKEMSMKGGLLPHYILGYIILNRREFVINPHFFATEKNFEKIIRNGLDINQAEFHSALNETDYTGYFVLDQEGNYFDINY